MGDDRLMEMARAAGYSMIPPQDASDGADETETFADPVDSAASTYLARVRSWLPHVPAGLTSANVRGTVTNWLTHRAPA